MGNTLEELLAEASVVDVAGWNFSWLDGRATEERPPWGYQKLMGEKIGRAALTLDIQTGGGEVLAGVAQQASKAMAATESWPPNLKRAQESLREKGVIVVADEDEPPLPFADGTFDLVTSRHPVTAYWGEIAGRPGQRPCSMTSSLARSRWGKAAVNQNWRGPGPTPRPTEGPARADPGHRAVHRLLPLLPDRGSQA